MLLRDAAVDQTATPMPGEEPEDVDFVGRILCEKWRIVGLLGRGWMSAVYEARHRNGARVAIKILNAALARNERARRRFLGEARIANSVEHPGVVRVLDDEEMPDGRPFLVMDRLEGETLRARCAAAGGSLAPRDVLRIADRVLEVLSVAHARGVVHRDIKPANIFLTTNGDVRVLDFGIAAVWDELAESVSSGDGEAALGTPAFMAPEQARGRQGRADPRSDIWAVGATMYYCLAGRHVHEHAATADDAIVFAATQRAPSLSRSCPAIEPRIAHVVDGALALAPSDRWPSADSMRAAIAAATERPLVGPTLRPVASLEPDETLESVASSHSPRAPRAKGGRGRDRAMAAAVVVGCLATAAGLLAIRGRSTRPVVGDWACLDRPPLPSDPSLKVDVQLIAFDVYQPYTLGSAVDGGNDFSLIQYSPLPGTAIEACTSLDPMCASPNTPEISTDDAGVAHLSVLGSFVGVYRISRPDSFPQIYYPGRLVAGEPRVTYPVSAVAYKTFGMLGGALRVDTNRDVTGGDGHLIVTANDCEDRQMPGIAIDLTNVRAGLSFYLQDNFPNPMATQTDSHGAAVFINVREGNVTIQATRVLDHRLIGTMNVYVHSGTITFVDIRPRVRGE